MRGSMALVVLLTLVLMTPSLALAGPYADEMAKCLVRSTTDADRNFLVKWMFAAAALHPAVKSIAAISDTQRDELNRSTAKMLERLVTESCKVEMTDAIKYEGTGTIQTSFQVLGQVAARGLFADPSVAQAMADVDNHMDRQKIEKLFGPLQ